MECEYDQTSGRVFAHQRVLTTAPVCETRFITTTLPIKSPRIVPHESHRVFESVGRDDNWERRVTVGTLCRRGKGAAKEIIPNRWPALGLAYVSLAARYLTYRVQPRRETRSIHRVRSII